MTGALIAALVAWGHQMWPVTPASAVWPNIVAAVVCAIPAFLVHHVWTEKRHERLIHRLKAHHSEQIDAVHAALRGIHARLGATPDEELQVVAQAAIDEIEQEAADGEAAAR